jgi:hypothetical protein
VAAEDEYVRIGGGGLETIVQVQVMTKKYGRGAFRIGRGMVLLSEMMRKV